MNMYIIIGNKTIGYFGIQFLSTINEYFWENGQVVYLEQLFDEHFVRRSTTNDLSQFGKVRFSIHHRVLLQ